MSDRTMSWSKFIWAGRILFVVRTFETSLAPGPSYGLSFSSTLGFWFQRPKL